MRTTARKERRYEHERSELQGQPQVRRARGRHPAGGRTSRGLRRRQPHRAKPDRRTERVVVHAANAGGAAGHNGGEPAPGHKPKRAAQHEHGLRTGGDQPRGAGPGQQPDRRTGNGAQRREADLEPADHGGDGDELHGEPRLDGRSHGERQQLQQHRRSDDGVQHHLRVPDVRHVQLQGAGRQRRRLRRGVLRQGDGDRTGKHERAGNGTQPGGDTGHRQRGRDSKVGPAHGKHDDVGCSRYLHGRRRQQLAGNGTEQLVQQELQHNAREHERRKREDRRERNEHARHRRERRGKHRGRRPDGAGAAGGSAEPDCEPGGQNEHGDRDLVAAGRTGNPLSGGTRRRHSVRGGAERLQHHRRRPKLHNDSRQSDVRRALVRRLRREQWRNEREPEGHGERGAAVQREHQRRAVPPPGKQLHLRADAVRGDQPQLQNATGHRVRRDERAHQESPAKDAWQQPRVDHNAASDRWRNGNDPPAERPAMQRHRGDL